MSYVGTDVTDGVIVALIVVVDVIVVLIVVVVGSMSSGSEAHTSLAHGLEQMLYTSSRGSISSSSSINRLGGVV
jgi:hypothetical protein